MGVGLCLLTSGPSEEDGFEELVEFFFEEARVSFNAWISWSISRSLATVGSFPRSYKASASRLSTTQPLFKSRVERIAPDGLERSVGLVCLISLAAAGGRAQIGPVGGVVTGPSEEIGVDEGLDPVDGMCIESLPVARQNPGASCQQMRGQIGDNNPGKHQEAEVVGQ